LKLWSAAVELLCWNMYDFLCSVFLQIKVPHKQNCSPYCIISITSCYSDKPFGNSV